jgi:multidrug efflux system outer membrane protein
MKKLLLPVSLLCLIAAGCTMAPKFQQPVAPVSSNWPVGPAYGTNQTVTNRSAADLPWSEFFHDVRLQQIIGLALTNNRDLRVAVLNVEQSRAQYHITRADLFPTVNASGSGTRQRIPGDVLSAGFSGFGPTGPVTYNQFSANVGVTSYEVDLFGRVRSLNRQALETYFSTGEARRSFQISLVAEVATQYLTEIQLDDQLALARRTLAAVQSSYDLNQKSYDVGSSSELDLQTSKAQVGTAEANIADYERQRAQAENALVLLVGQPLPTNLPAPVILDGQQIPSDLPPGLPSDLLLRRPDILEAEHTLKAANANIGAARAAFFPKITLTGSAGYQSIKLSRLFSGPQLAWSFTPEIELPIFDGGKNRANLDVANISRRIEVAQYEKAIQSAFREVADALAAKTTLDRQIQAETSVVAAEQKRYQLAEMRYRSGVENYLTVLSAQQDLYSSQQQLLQLQLSRLSNLITLYKSLGGGWQTVAQSERMAMNGNPAAKESK